MKSGLIYYTLQEKVALDSMPMKCGLIYYSIRENGSGLYADEVSSTFSGLIITPSENEVLWTLHRLSPHNYNLNHQPLDSPPKEMTAGQNTNMALKPIFAI